MNFKKSSTLIKKTLLIEKSLAGNLSAIDVINLAGIIHKKH